MSSANEVDLNVGHLLQLVRRKLWLIVLAALALGGAGYGLSRLTTPVYMSATTLMVDSQAGAGAADYSALLASQRLVATYARIVVSSPVLDAAAEELGPPYSGPGLQKRAEAVAIADTQLIDLTVETGDPDESAAIANAIADAFQAEIDDATTSDLAALRSNLDGELDNLNADLDAARGDLAGASTDEAAAIRQEIDQLTRNLESVQERRDNLRFSASEQTIRIRQLEPAVPDPSPVRPQPPLYIAIGAIIGALGAAALVILRDHLDNAVRSADELTSRFDLPVLGTIPQFRTDRNPFVTVTSPNEPASEAFRDLRLNLKHIGKTEEIRSLLITSARPGEGKSTTSTSLAVANAQTGQVTIVVDGDMRRADLSGIFNISPGTPGMANIFDETSKVFGDLRSVVCRTADLDGLYVVPAGFPAPSNPSLLLESSHARSAFKQLTDGGDFLVVDAPPVLGLADAPTMAQYMDGVLIVVNYGETSMSDVAGAVDRLQQLDATVVGFVLVDSTGKLPKQNGYGAYLDTKGS